ncbi:restriction endonuclease subunit S [Enterobacter cloacae]|nr:restriction endonuclease subunit S [Enterobacter cloacae]
MNQYLSFANESTGVPQLTAPQVAKYLVNCPSIEEQTAIATILSDMDAELSILEQKLAKVRDLKQGMMQQLLTGRIRLPLDHQP